MSPKFWLRTIRSMAFRKRPYFAHLAFTHKCNLRCRFCHIQEERFEELDTAGMKRIIDRLDSLGVAILSVSGGGEPLTRPDFAVLLDYAAEKGMFTKITSNGTMPLAKYDALLSCKVSEIAISLDGVRGNDLPYSHVGPKILETIRHLNDRLPPKKLLTINVTVSSENRDQVDEIVAYCTREFPNARIWLNPVVVGQGRLRVPTQLKVNPDYLWGLDSQALLTPTFYKRACEEYYRNEVYNWGCLAGEFFFDIKPNGDLWICQDHPAKTRLNILDEDFKKKYRATDFSYRRQCGGCTYSCYYLTQKAFEPHAWPGMAEIWWKTATRPEEACRKTAERRGWAAGLLHFSGARLLTAAHSMARATLWIALLATIAGGRPAQAQLSPRPGEPEEIVSRMEECNAQRSRILRFYRSHRRYVAANPRLHRKAYVVVEARFDALEGKKFNVLERGGSRGVERRVFAPMLEVEQSNSRPPARESVEISRRNYRFLYEGLDPSTGAHVFKVEPRTAGKALFKGKVWVNAEDFGIQRIEGEPAERPSFWIRSTRFVHEYGRFGGFWFPVQNRTEVELRLFGRSSLGIDYFDYEWQPRIESACSLPRLEVAIQPLPLTLPPRPGAFP